MMEINEHFGFPREINRTLRDIQEALLNLSYKQMMIAALDLATVNQPKDGSSFSSGFENYSYPTGKVATTAVYYWLNKMDSQNCKYAVARLVNILIDVFKNPKETDSYFLNKIKNFLQTIKETKGAEIVVPKLCAQLQNKNLSPVIERRIVLFLVSMGEATKEMLPLFLQALNSDSSQERDDGVCLLPIINHLIGKAEIPSLIEVLIRDNDSRETVFPTLQKIGNDSFPYLIQALPKIKIECVQRMIVEYLLKQNITIGNALSFCLPGISQFECDQIIKVFEAVTTQQSRERAELEAKQQRFEHFVNTVLAIERTIAEQGIPAALPLFNKAIENLLSPNPVPAPGSIDEQYFTFRNKLSIAMMNVALFAQSKGHEAKETIPVLLLALQNSMFEVKPILDALVALQAVEAISIIEWAMDDIPHHGNHVYEIDDEDDFLNLWDAKEKLESIRDNSGNDITESLDPSL